MFGAYKETNYIRPVQTGFGRFGAYHETQYVRPVNRGFGLGALGSAYDDDLRRWSEASRLWADYDAAMADYSERQQLFDRRAKANIYYQEQKQAHDLAEQKRYQTEKSAYDASVARHREWQDAIKRRTAYIAKYNAWQSAVATWQPKWDQYAAYVNRVNQLKFQARQNAGSGLKQVTPYCMPSASEKQKQQNLCRPVIQGLGAARYSATSYGYISDPCYQASLAVCPLPVPNPGTKPAAPGGLPGPPPKEPLVLPAPRAPKPYPVAKPPLPPKLGVRPSPPAVARPGAQPNPADYVTTTSTELPAPTDWGDESTSTPATTDDWAPTEADGGLVKKEPPPSGGAGFGTAGLIALLVVVGAGGGYAYYRYSKPKAAKR